ncbi:MAG TPA: hypothetical protein VFZ52_07290 [Chryseolinea sp.]
MNANKLIVSSIAKGLFIGAVLVFFHIVASHNDSTLAKVEIFKVASHQDAPSHQESELEFRMASNIVNVAMSLETIRDMLILLVVVFNINASAKIFSLSVPIPLGKQFSTLFSSVISPNAP